MIFNDEETEVLDVEEVVLLLVLLRKIFFLVRFHRLVSFRGQKTYEGVGVGVVVLESTGGVQYDVGVSLGVVGAGGGV